MAKKKLVALCACTMGLAHTFMAAQALEDAAKELGYDVKVETQGADGIQNELTPAEIEMCIRDRSVCVPRGPVAGLGVPFIPHHQPALQHEG